MKLSVSQPELYHASQKVSRVAATRTTLPTIQGILLNATEDGKLQLRATNLTLMETITLDAQVEIVGTTVVPRTFVDLVANLKGEVQLELSKLQLSVKAGKSKSKLNCYEWEDFPRVATPESWTNLSATDFLAGLASTLFSVNEVDYLATSGVHLHLDGDFMNFEATDGIGRISMAKFPVLSEEASCIVPKAACSELVKMLEGEVAQVAFGSSMTVRCGNSELSTQLLEGEFPDCSRMAQTEFTLVAKSFKNEFLAALKQVSVLASSFVTLSFNGNSLTFNSTSQELGNSDSEIEVEKTGEDIVVRLNPKFLKDAVEAIPTSAFYFKMSPNKFVTIAPYENESCLFLIAPVNVKSSAGQETQ